MLTYRFVFYKFWRAVKHIANGLNIANDMSMLSLFAQDVYRRIYATSLHMGAYPKL